MGTILVYYHEVTHNDPAGWEEVADYQIGSSTDGWLTEHPGGIVKAMTRETFARTVYGKAALAKKRRGDL